MSPERALLDRAREVVRDLLHARHDKRAWGSARGKATLLLVQLDQVLEPPTTDPETETELHRRGINLG